MRVSNYNLNQIYRYSIYFMKGTDTRLLDVASQKQIHNIVSNYQGSSSFLIFNPKQIRNKLQAWNRKLPWIRPYYAVKSNPIDVLVKQLVIGGAGLDCASKTEITQALKYGLQSKDIVYSNPVKDKDDLKWAYQNGITLTTADTIGQINKIKQIAPKMKILWRISITQESTDKLATPFSIKFGDDINSIQDIHNRMKQIQGMGVRIQGIHFHCGSGPDGSSAFRKAIILAQQCLKIGRQYGHRMQILDIGGGFPSGNLDKSTIEALQLTRNNALGYQVIAEPGRHFSAYSCYLLTSILGKRIKNGKVCYHINDSVYHTFNCTIMDGVSFQNSNQFYSKILNGQIQPVQQKQNSAIFGMTCCGGDIITNNIQIPKQAEIGDWLCFSGMGSYTYGPRSNYNGMKTLQNIIVWNDQITHKTPQYQ